MQDNTERTKTLDSEPGLSTLAVAGVEFTLPNRGDKQPFTKGWPDYRPDLATVAAHLAAGGNLGVHNKYADGWVLVTFDGQGWPHCCGWLLSWSIPYAPGVLVAAVRLWRGYMTLRGSSAARQRQT